MPPEVKGLGDTYEALNRGKATLVQYAGGAEVSRTESNYRFSQLFIDGNNQRIETLLK